jgi:3',5'-cyclic AMP phosphodiesterase CpdA
VKNVALALAAFAMVLAAGCSGRVVPTLPVDDSRWVDATSVVAAGDIADCRDVPPGASGAARTAALISPADAIVLTLGDNTYPVGAAPEFSECFDATWGKFGARLRPSPGNHDYQTPGATGYFDYFGERAGPERRGYYSFDVRGWHVVSLNSSVDATPGSPQYRWLIDDLKASAAVPCILAVWHHPVFSSGPHGNDPRMAHVLAALYAAGADVVLAGHDHVYERFEPHDAAGAADPLRGIRSFTVGTGGARLYRFKEIHPRSVVREASDHGVLRLALGDGRYRWEFMPVGGGPALDRGVADCH